jgi:hypothetical protein
VVTHSPQVAARGAHHWRVSKAVDRRHDAEPGGAAGAPDRVDEVARMLAGDTVTEEARAAARALLAAAGWRGGRRGLGPPGSPGSRSAAPSATCAGSLSFCASGGSFLPE